MVVVAGEYCPLVTSSPLGLSGAHQGPHSLVFMSMESFKILSLFSYCCMGFLWEATWSFFFFNLLFFLALVQITSGR